MKGEWITFGFCFKWFQSEPETPFSFLLVQSQELTVKEVDALRKAAEGNEDLAATLP